MERAYEVELRVKRNRGYKSQKLDNPNLIYKFIRRIYGAELLIYESSYILMFNANFEVIAYGLVSKGDNRCACVDVKTICKYCIDTMCIGAVFVHNHPSGNPKPSKQDNYITKRIKDALEIFGVVLCDSIIVTDKDYYSYRDNNALN